MHQVSGSDLSELATYRLAGVPDGTNPSLYWPAEIGALLPAPDASGRFIVGTIRSSAYGMLGSSPQFVQVLGPGLASPTANAGKVLLIGVDWDAGSLYSIENVDPFPLRQVPFSPAAGADVAAARVVRTGLFAPTLWYASANLLHLSDGRTIRVADGTDGPSLPFTADQCGRRDSILVCLDTANDQLVRIDADTLALQATAGLGSYLRGQSLVEPDFSVPITYLGGIRIIDDSTFTLAGKDVHVGRWH